MKPVIFAALLSASAGGALLSNNLKALISDAYPADASKREALKFCILENPNFNRLASAERDACYRRELANPIPMAARVTTGVAPNLMELQQAVAWKHAPSNDIRVIQASQAFTSSLVDGPRR